MSAPRFSHLPQTFAIREARLDDAVPACHLVRASIVELCRLDHDDDRGLLAVWLANKTPDNFRAWIAQSHVFVAERAGALAGVGALTAGGEITLTYVLPSHRFTGISRALLLAMEERARDLGLEACWLETTRTAEAFYREAGYEDAAGSRGRMRLAKTL